jgi:hypothetical protein
MIRKAVTDADSYSLSMGHLQFPFPLFHEFIDLQVKSAAEARLD